MIIKFLLRAVALCVDDNDDDAIEAALDDCSDIDETPDERSEPFLLTHELFDNVKLGLF